MGSRAEAAEKEVRAGRNSSSYFKAMPLSNDVEMRVFEGKCCRPVVMELRTGLCHHVLLRLVIGRHGLLQCLRIL